MLYARGERSITCRNRSAATCDKGSVFRWPSVAADYSKPKTTDGGRFAEWHSSDRQCGRHVCLYRIRMPVRSAVKNGEVSWRIKPDVAQLPQVTTITREEPAYLRQRSLHSVALRSRTMPAPFPTAYRQDARSRLVPPPRARTTCPRLRRQ